MRLQAIKDFTYADKDWRPGDILDAPRETALELINRDKAVPFNLEDPSGISLADRVENLLPTVPPVSLSPTSAQVSAAGSSGSFQVTMTGPGQSGTWTATKDATADWLVFSPATPQSSDGPVDYTVLTNIGGDRSANIYVNGKTFTISQEAATRPA